MNKVYRSIYDDFKSMQRFTELNSGIIEIINIQYVDYKYFVFYYQVSDRCAKQ